MSSASRGLKIYLKSTFQLISSFFWILADPVAMACDANATTHWPSSTECRTRLSTGMAPP